MKENKGGHGMSGAEKDVILELLTRVRIGEGFKRREADNTVWFTADNIKTRHCFESASGGREQCGFSSPDIIIARQIHSSRVLYVSEMPSVTPECDGFVTDRAGVTIAVKTADCTPILLCDDTAGVVGALHGGWRGAAAGIAREGVSLMIERGAKIDRIQAAIGPSNKVCCYEVGEDFICEVADKTALSREELFNLGILCNRQKGSDLKIYADVVRINLIHLLLSGICPENITVSPLCTQCNYGLLRSYRASGGDKTPMLSIITSPKN